jgi:hypothetical protein
MDEWVSLQSGVVTESKLIAETSALPTVNGGTTVGKLNGGNCVGAPEGKKQLYKVYSLLGTRQDYRDRSEVKWKHQLLVYPDV